MKVRRVVLWVVCLVAAVSGAVSSGPLLAAEGIPWQQDILFQHRSFDEDIKDVLSELLKQNGLQTIFKKSVEGVVTIEFSSIPLQAAFNKLIEENSLKYTYDALSKTVTIMSEATSSVIRLFTPRYMSLTEIEQALVTFKLKNVAEFVFDASSGSVLLKGDQATVGNLQKIMGELDVAAGERMKLIKERQMSDLRTRAQLDSIDRKQRLENLEEEAYNVKIKIIPLQYANAGSVEMSFQGEAVTVPGIDESIKTLFGLSTVSGKDDGNTSATGVETVQFEEARFDVPLLAIDERTNSIIVRGTARAIEQVEQIVKRLDKPVPMVELEVLIVQAEANTSRQLGVDWTSSKTSNDGERTSGISTNNGGNLSNWSDDVDPVSLLSLDGQGTGGLAASFIFNGPRGWLESQIDAFESDSKLYRIASPRVVTLNNLEARVTSSTTRNFKIYNEGQGVADLKSVDTGLELEITPSVIHAQHPGGQRFVRLVVHGTNSSFGSDDSDGNPRTTEKEVQTTVIIPDQSTFILGGLFETDDKITDQGVPGFKDIPALGWLFKNNSDAKSRTETIFIITPKIVELADVVPNDIGARSYMHSQMDLNRRQMRNNMRLPPVNVIEEDE